MEYNTSTKIQVPAVGDTSEMVTIVGAKDCIEKAMHEIRVLSDEQVGPYVALSWIVFIILHHEYIVCSNSLMMCVLKVYTLMIILTTV